MFCFKRDGRLNTTDAHFLVCVRWSHSSCLFGYGCFHSSSVPCPREHRNRVQDHVFKGTLARITNMHFVFTLNRWIGLCSQPCPDLGVGPLVWMHPTTEARGVWRSSPNVTPKTTRTLTTMGPVYVGQSCLTSMLAFYRMEQKPPIASNCAATQGRLTPFTAVPINFAGRTFKMEIQKPLLKHP